VKLGTRGSALALAQAGTVAAAIEGAELETITTSGDRGFDPSDDKERWVRELDEALLDGRVEIEPLAPLPPSPSRRAALTAEGTDGAASSVGGSYQTR
jgi:hydroxymethylbilane synthase